MCILWLGNSETALPDQTQNELELAVHDVRGVDVDQGDPLPFEELQRDGDVFKLLRSERRLLVVLRHALAGQNLDEGDQLETVGQLRLQVVDLKRRST